MKLFGNNIDTKTITFTTVVVLVLLFVFAIYFPIRIKSDTKITVYKGQGLSSIAQTLKNNGLIESKELFVLYVRLFNGDKVLKAGDYVFSGYVNVPGVASTILKGLSEPNDIKVVIPEGSNVWQVDGILAKQELITEGEFAAKFYKDEGYFFPDTYLFPDPKEGNGLTVDEIAKKLENNFSSTTSSFATPNFRNAVTIASVLEKEAKSEEDMRLIAGIIEKRMQMGLKLELDATVSYGACLRKFTGSKVPKDCDVSLIGVADEIKIDGPYNTYTRLGLPPGPISNPGLKALDAALNPIRSDYLYYLSTRDGSQIIYAKTAAEHLANRKKYLGF